MALRNCPLKFACTCRRPRKKTHKRSLPDTLRGLSVREGLHYQNSGGTIHEGLPILCTGRGWGAAGRGGHRTQAGQESRFPGSVLELLPLSLHTAPGS